eukprot:jgi/Ulvmu1/10474/UM064_0011.1
MLETFSAVDGLRIRLRRTSWMLRHAAHRATSMFSGTPDVRRLAMMIDFWCIAMNRASVFYHLVEHTSVTYLSGTLETLAAPARIGADDDACVPGGGVPPCIG